MPIHKSGSATDGVIASSGLTPALTTEASTCVPVDILVRELVALLALDLVQVPQPSSGQVLDLLNQFEVIGTDAQLHFTQVVDLQWLRDRTTQQYPRCAMCSDGPIVHPEHAVPAISPSGPHPVILLDADEVDESLQFFHTKERIGCL